jgi:mono/diheme cytochrome c family protein
MRIRTATLVPFAAPLVAALVLAGCGQAGPADTSGNAGQQATSADAATGEATAQPTATEQPSAQDSATQETTDTSQPSEPATTEAPTTTDAPAETTAATDAAGGGATPVGKVIFESAGCAGCHTLADAGANGAVGPNLDDLKPSAAQVAAKVAAGGGGMPSFAGQLSDQEIQDVAAYVSAVAGAPANTGGGGADGAGGTDAAGGNQTGKELFTSAGCASCHTLAEARASGNVGPNLDQESPDVNEVVDMVTAGGGGMPSFRGKLSEAEILRIARFVATATGGSLESDSGGGSGDDRGGRGSDDRGRGSDDSSGRGGGSGSDD